VRLTAELEPRPAAGRVEVAGTPQQGLLAWLFRRRPAAAEPVPSRPEIAPAQALDPRLAQGALTAVLDEIGAARHRPFSRELEVSPPAT
jgi:hypothetical protein